MILELTLGIIFIIISISLLLLVPLIIGAPFEPSKDDKIKTILKLASPQKKDKIVDLGSGDGRIVIAFAEKGYEAHGYEINPWLVLYSIIIARVKGAKNAHFHLGNFWNKNLSKFNIVTLFQIGYIMPKLEKKIEKECKSRTKIVSNKWTFPNINPKKIENNVKLYIIN
ncbi:methyltransferase domain-containing protein [Candidatus Pacearchaeota archaeon]|nr:methyltransferase domain-containing protein [Candidatus Pacearchaeota archaeon]